MFGTSHLDQPINPSKSSSKSSLEAPNPAFETKSPVHLLVKLSLASKAVEQSIQMEHSSTTDIRRNTPGEIKKRNTRCLPTIRNAMPPELVTLHAFPTMGRIRTPRPPCKKKKTPIRV